MGYLSKSGLQILCAQIFDKLKGKVDAVDGKGLSTNDFTDAEKAKLAELNGEQEYRIALFPTEEGFVKDKTYAEMLEAYEAGKNLVFIDMSSGMSVPLAQAQEDNMAFVSPVPVEGNTVMLTVNNDDTIQADREAVIGSLNFTGAVEATFNGTGNVTVEIPKELPDGAEAHQMLVTDAEGNKKWEERTHYVGNGTVDYLPECEGTLIDAEGMFIITEPFKHDFVFGETYTVYWNSVAYETVCKEFIEDEGDPPTPGLGDMDLLMGTGSTGEPFFIAVTPNGIEGNTEITAMLAALDGSTSATLKIEGEGEVVHKIPDKFINFPESDVMIVDCTSETALDFTTLKPNKTFAQVEEAYNSGKHVIFRIDGFLDVPVIGVAGDQISGRIFSNTQIESFWMTRNEEYLTHDVSHINREVGLVYMSVSKTGGIQTGTIFSSVEGLREICKTVVCIFSDAREGIVCELPLLSYNQTAKTAVFGLASNERFIKVTILASSQSFEYIPMGVNLEGYATEEYVQEQSAKDWSVNDETDPAYVKNRTHWVEDGVIEIIPEQTFTVDSDMGGAFLTEPLSTSLIADKTYTIQWNGTEYTSVAQVVQEDGITIGVAIGNVDLVNGVGDTGEPFVIIEVAKELVEQSGGIYAQIVPLDESTTFITKVGYEGAIYHTIAQEYLPEYLYGYVGGEEICLPEITVPIGANENGSVFTQRFTSNLVVGDEYTVVWNGVSYTATAKQGEDSPVYLGNLSFISGANEDTGEAFFVTQYIDETLNSQGIYGAAYMDPSDDITEAREITFSILKDGKKIRKIPEEFLPDSANEKVITLTADPSTGNFAADMPFAEAWTMTELELQKAIRIDIGAASMFTGGASGGICNVSKQSITNVVDQIVIHFYCSYTVGENNYSPEMLQFVWNNDNQIIVRYLDQLPYIDNPTKDLTLYYDYGAEGWEANYNHSVSREGQGWFAKDVYVGGTSASDGKRLVTEDDVDEATQGLIDGLNVKNGEGMRSVVIGWGSAANGIDELAIGRFNIADLYYEEITEITPSNPYPLCDEVGDECIIISSPQANLATGKYEYTIDNDSQTTQRVTNGRMGTGIYVYINDACFIICNDTTSNNIDNYSVDYGELHTIKRVSNAFAIGNGTSNTARSNAHTVDWNGNAWYAGDVYVGGTDQANGSEKLMTASEVTAAINAALAAILPTPTANDAGKILRVNAEGKYELVALTNAEEATF